MSSQSKPEVLESEIRKRAYLIWETEGRPNGQHIEHWLRAKAQLDNEARKESRPAKAASARSSGTARKRSADRKPSTTSH